MIINKPNPGPVCVLIPPPTNVPSPSGCLLVYNASTVSTIRQCSLHLIASPVTVIINGSFEITIKTRTKPQFKSIVFYINCGRLLPNSLRQYWQRIHTVDTTIYYGCGKPAYKFPPLLLLSYPTMMSPTAKIDRHHNNYRNCTQSCLSAAENSSYLIDLSILVSWIQNSELVLTVICNCYVWL